jgi:hypothetical protein
MPRKLVILPACCLCLLLLAWGALPATAGTTPIRFRTPVTMPGSEGGNEPYVAVAAQTAAAGPAGFRYVTWQSPGRFAGSPDGATFTPLTTPDETAAGDTQDQVDATGALYNSQICGDAFALHTCIYRSTDGGRTWPLKTEPADVNPGASDRPWIDVFPKTGPSQDPGQTTVYLEYHTFTPDDLVYVTVSHDGGATFGPPAVVSTDPVSGASSVCNTVPSGIVADQNRPGVVYALWLSGDDPFANLSTGCNYSQIGPFTKAWVSVSLDGGATWTPHLAWQGRFDPLTKRGDNADKIFGTISVDGAGQVHVLLPVRFDDDPVTFTTTGREEPEDTALLLLTSPDGGIHWTPPFQVSGSTRGSHFFPWIAAGSRGIVDGIFYYTPSRLPNDPTSQWYVEFVQVTGAAATTTGGTHYATTPRVRRVRVNPNVVHTGGICTFGVFCAAVGGNRNLADSISIALNPAGGAELVWTSDQGIAPSSRIDFSCQTSGPSAFAGMPPISGCYRARR